METVNDQEPAARPTSRLRRARTLFLTLIPVGAIVLSVLTLAGYVMGLVRDRVFAHTFGASGELDAYNAAFVLPELALDVLIAGGLVAPFVPIFTGLATEAGREAREFGRTILTYAVVVMAIAAGLLAIFAPQTAAFIAPGFQGAQRDLYISLFRLMCVTPVIFAASIVLGEILVAERRFFWYGLAPLFYNGGIVVGTLLFADRYGIYAAAIGAVVGSLAHLGIRLVGISRTSFRPRVRLGLRAKGLAEFVRLMIPKMVSHPIEPLTFLFFTALASTLVPGSVSSVSFARNFASVPVSLIGASFAIAAFPALSVQFARGDRRGFGRTFGTTLLSITVITVVGAAVLFVIAESAIRLLLGGGAFDEEDITRTGMVLALFAIAVPLESLTHLLSRAVYATHETLLPSIASVVGFIVTVAVAESLLPSGIVAIPASFAAGMAVKLAILAIVLAPRMARIGPPGAVRRRPIILPGLTEPVRGRLATAIMGTVLVVLTVGAVFATGRVVSGVSIGAGPAVTPWARVNPPASGEPTPLGSAGSSAPVASGVGPAGSGGPAAASPVASVAPSAIASSPTPKPGPFSMDLFQPGDFVGEFTDTWCVAAAMQTSMNIMDTGADKSRDLQNRLFKLGRSIAPAPDGAAEPEGWAQGLAQLGYGNYEVRAAGSIRTAIHIAARQIRLTGRPAGLMVWRGAHSWVMSGFDATADPAAGDFTVTAVNIEDVWYPRFSTIWGYSRGPDASYLVDDLSVDFLPWKRPRGSYPDKDGKYVVVVPVP